MKKFSLFKSVIVLTALLCVNHVFAQNPIITNQFSADPTARVFDGKIYVYPSHDIPARPGKGRAGWFVMEDYHVFSSENLTDWTDHGVIVSQYNVPWVDSTMFNMWAPDCMYRNGKYYFYFPAGAKDKSKRGGIGVAVADKPYGPFKPEPEPIVGIGGIDPNIFMDRDGQAYIITAMGRFTIAKLKDNMLEIEGKPQVIDSLPTKGLKEGPFMFERNGIYYLTYPHVQDKTEQLEYAIGNNPMGPFKVTGVIMDERPECWTNHQSIVKYKDQWYLFYHSNDLSPNFDKNRSVRIDSLFFNADGTIRKVIPTLRGVGITDASQQIQIDRYSLKSENGTNVNFLSADTTKRFEGWKTIFTEPNSWVQYNSVDFGKNKSQSVIVRCLSSTGGTIQILLDKIDGPVIAEIKIPTSAEWKIVDSPILKFEPGVHNLIVQLKENDHQPHVEIDWVSFR